MVAFDSETAMQLQARTFVATIAAQGLSALADRINGNPQCSATVTTTTSGAAGLGQTALAVFRTSPKTGYRDEIFACVVYAYEIEGAVSVDVLLRPGIVDGERHGMASGPLRIPGFESTPWNELTVEHVRAYAETAFRAALVRPEPAQPPRPLLWRKPATVPRTG